MRVDLEDDRFDVTYDPKELTVDELLGTIEKLDYAPEVVDSNSGDPAAPTRIELAGLPADLRSLFIRARRAGKPVLLRFTGPG